MEKAKIGIEGIANNELIGYSKELRKAMQKQVEDRRKRKTTLQTIALAVFIPFLSIDYSQEPRIEEEPRQEGYSSYIATKEDCKLEVITSETGSKENLISYQGE
jgi:hypothetical protein